MQGTNVINSFPWSYNGGIVGVQCPVTLSYYCEANLAISNGHVTTTWFGNVIGTGVGYGGQYTLSGTPTGVSWPGASPPPGVINEPMFDGTSDGTHNYGVGVAAVPGSPQVVSYDLQWQNPTALFVVPSGNEGITYDPVDNALWIAGGNPGIVVKYSLTGALLSSFDSGLLSISALAYDPADDTLWLNYGQSNFLAQYSKTGVLLQSGAVPGLPDCCYLAGEIASQSVPEPASMALLGTGPAGLWFAVRRRNRLPA